MEMPNDWYYLNYEEGAECHLCGSKKQTRFFHGKGGVHISVCKKCVKDLDEKDWSPCGCGG